MSVAEAAPTPLGALGSELRRDNWALAVEVVDEGLHDHALVSLAGLSRAAQLGDLATFIGELGREIAQPEPGRLRPDGPLAEIARGHARARETLGFGPREVVTEFMLMRRVLQRYVSAHSTVLRGSDLIDAEERLNDAIDRLTVECVGAYFDRAIEELSELARRDPLTGLLNHQAFSDVLGRELERARRYGHGLTLVFIDLDGFKQINDTLGHLEGDRVLRCVGSAALGMLRGSDVAGRLGGDEFGALLLEADKHSAERFLRRLLAEFKRLCEQGELPPSFTCSAGAAHYPSEALEPESLFRLADARQYEAKRSK
jgi:diguanylate cyclase (GGDEF)-like protein